MRSVAAGIALTVAVSVMLPGCGDDGPSSTATARRGVVEITTQRCDRPNRFSGWGIRVGGRYDGRIVTAAHLVDGELRDLRVDGRAARVARIDPRTDLAVVQEQRPWPPSPTVSLASPPAMLAAAGGAGDAWLVTGTAVARPVDVRRATTLLVDDLATGDTHRRSALVFAPAVREGVSGAPIVDAGGAAIGLVALSDPGTGVSYATSADEIEDVIAGTRAFPRRAPRDCARVR